ncbi:MAG: four-carbon acid sugar kinase family protein [Thermosipho sp. (in: Bacteria)]|nr:four-carbon acid sugar kinase family protein [Thermosipho sp. (in: thermotogales)]
MIKYAIIADDLTGANASGILLTKLGVSIISLKQQTNLDNDFLEKYDAITYSTESRALDANEAYLRVFDITSKLKDKNLKVFNKRIDSTLRGNIGAEIDAMLDALSNDFVAFMVPAFPKSGRITIGGRLLVNCVPLHKTDAAKDPKAPVKTSSVMEIVTKQTKRKAVHIPIEFLQHSLSECVEIIKKFFEEGNKIFIFDATNDKDIEKIGKIALNSGLNFITVDPGPFTASVVEQNELSNKVKNKILMVIGSVTDTTKKQLDYLKLTKQDTKIINISADKLLDLKQRNFEIEKVVKEAIEAAKSSNLICLTTINNGKFKLNLSEISKKTGKNIEKLSQMINSGMAEIAYQVLNINQKFDAIFSSGGDTTIALIEKIEAKGIELMDEILPLAVAGKIIGGEFNGLRIATKGGMIGNESGILQCIDYLQSSK